MGREARIHFLGAAGTVTGSKFLIDLPEKQILVDCGMFQGIKKLRELNWKYLPIEAKNIDLVLISHGHMDHTGFLPRLVDMGYRGPIWGTEPTLDIAEIILRDSAKIQEEDAKRANKEGFTKHKPAKPLYNTQDVEQTLPFFEDKPAWQWIEMGRDIRLRFQPNGHILGSTFIELEVHSRRLVFSGDVGRQEDPLLEAPGKPEKADYLILESTYGDRRHPQEEEQKLERIINETVERQGTLIIPSFAVERAQLLMYLLWQLRKNGTIPGVPIILDSPMGASVLKLFQRHPEWHKLSEDECAAMCSVVRVVQDYSETWDIIDDPQPKIVIAGSGMVTGGRVLTYLQQYVERPETTVMLAGYQAEGTRGRQMLDGCPEIKFYGKYYKVNARIEYLESLSAHADQPELLAWVEDIDQKPGQVFLVHGEPQALDMMRLKLKDTYGWDARIPELFEIAEIEL